MIEKIVEPQSKVTKKPKTLLEPQQVKATASKGKKQQPPLKQGCSNKHEREKSRSPPSTRLLEERYTDYSKIKIGIEKLEVAKEHPKETTTKEPREIKEPNQTKESKESKK